MNRDLWELVKAFVEAALATEDTYTVYSAELKARFGLSYTFYEDMKIFAKEDRVDFEFESPNYKPDMPSMGFDIIFKKGKPKE